VACYPCLRRKGDLFASVEIRYPSLGLKGGMLVLFECVKEIFCERYYGVGT
jgi:hypothetical protein